MERIGRRTIAFFLLLMLGMLVAVLSVFTVANGTTLAQTADQQRSYRLEVAHNVGPSMTVSCAALQDSRRNMQQRLYQPLRMQQP